VVHVQVTPELHREYERRMTVAINSFHQRYIVLYTDTASSTKYICCYGELWLYIWDLFCRIDWLNKGSRALFGTVIEDQIYILIDTSASMLPSIQYLKDKLFLLMQVRNTRLLDLQIGRIIERGK
jgi:hypothetical protein